MLCLAFFRRLAVRNRLALWAAEFRRKCKLEYVIIKKFEYNPDRKLLKIELKYEFGYISIPNKFEIERIDFPDQFVIGTIQKKNFKQFIDTFHV
jgi:hypothetical protein